jgi:hypothetical protein
MEHEKACVPFIIIVTHLKQTSYKICPLEKNQFRVFCVFRGNRSFDRQFDRLTAGGAFGDRALPVGRCHFTGHHAVLVSFI